MEFIQQYLDVDRARDVILGWITSPDAYGQLAALVAAYVLAVVASRIVTPRLRQLLDPGTAEGWLAVIRRFVLKFTPLILPLLAYAFIGIGEQAIRSMGLGGDVIAFGKRVFIFLAVRTLVRDIITDPFLRMLGRYIFIPIAAMYALGILDTVSVTLAETLVGIGEIRFSVLSIVRAGIAGSILFWLGQWSTGHGTGYIRSQDEMRPPTRELAAKAFEMMVWAVAALLLINILGIDMSALAIMSGAIGVGLGFGLQKIASNFISGVILLLEGQATVGDYVELDGGEAGTIIKMMMRATILETFDGKWIVVPNEDFITTRIVNWSDAGSGNRYEVEFSVSYETDINRIPDIVGPAVARHPRVLDKPEKPDVELRGFGDSGVDFAVEFWVEGLDDGPNKFSSEVMFLIWNALKDADIEIPFPQRELRIRGGAVQVAGA